MRFDRKVKKRNRVSKAVDGDKAYAGSGMVGLDWVMRGKLRREIGVSKVADGDKAEAGLSKTRLGWVLIGKLRRERSGYPQVLMVSIEVIHTPGWGEGGSCTRESLL